MLRVLAVAALAAALPPLPKVPPLPALEHNGVEIVSQTAVDRQPGNPAVGFGSVWVPSSADGIVDRVDLKTRKVAARIRSGDTRTRAQNQYFDSVAVSAKAVWHASDVGGTVSRIDPRTNKLVKRVPVPGRPGAIAASAAGVYVTLFNTSTVLRLNPATLKVMKRGTIAGPALGVSFGAGSVWVVTSSGPSVLRLDPLTLRVQKRISIASRAPSQGGFASAWWVAADAASVCAGNYQQNVVSRIDTATGSVAEQTTLPFGVHPFSVAAVGGSCWAVNDAGVFRAGSYSHLPSIAPSEFVGVAAGPAGAWVTSAGRNALLEVR
jgi:DNA-binding beta-propeller fold protein YncE